MYDSRRYPILIFFFTVGFIYLLRLFYLQILDPKYQSFEVTNAIRKKVEIPLRGVIYDRKGKLLVNNEEVYDMYITPNKVKDLDTARFCKVFKITKSYFDSTSAVAAKRSKRRASVFLRQLSKTDYAQSIDAMVHFKGFHFEQSFFRKYPPSTLANALGYIAEIPKKLYENQETKYYRQGDYIGLAGLEKSYEEELRGIRGVRFNLFNSLGEDKGSYENGAYDTLPVLGKDLYTSIDLELQLLADSLFKNKVGGVVAIEPKSGEILALGSYPTYDPNLLSGKAYGTNYSKLLLNTDKPLLNRTISSFYRPGSTFKLVQSSIALERGLINPRTSFASLSSPFIFHSGPGEASSLTRAIQLSSNPYYYHVFKRIIGDNDESNAFKSARLGLASWGETVKKFGFGVKLGIDIPGEKAGLLPNVDQYDRMYGKERWKFSNIYSVSIGEGELGVNILKLANLAAIIANKGYWITPHLVNGVGEPGKNVEENLEVHQLGISRKNFEALYDGMQLVVDAGTARRAQIEGIPVLGKTGTSQNRKGKDHSIFIAFAPRENPQIAIAAVVENGGFGGSAAAPIASLMIEQFIKGKVERTFMKEQVMNTTYTTFAAKSTLQ